jgi:hypothetical protein
MFHKFKITTCVFILCLFGLTLTPHAQPLAYGEGSQEFIDEFDRCKGKSKKNKTKMSERKNCFGRLARTAATEDLGLGRTAGDMAPLRTDFNSCKTKFCGYRGWSFSDDFVNAHTYDTHIKLMDDQVCPRTMYDASPPTKDQIKETMHCYAAIAREVYDILSD